MEPIVPDNMPCILMSVGAKLRSLESEVKEARSRLYATEAAYRELYYRISDELDEFTAPEDV